MPSLETLVCCLLLAATAIAQDEQSGKGGGEGEEQVPVLTPPVHAADRGPVVSTASPLGVIVEHDPYRIAPATTGLLILRIPVSRGCKVLQGGRIDFEKEQGPLVLGAPVWDPLPAGKDAYDDTFLIKIPLSVAADTEYGLYPVAGKVELRGEFRPVQPGIHVREEAGDPALVSRRPWYDPKRAESGFKGKVKVGPPVPAVPAVFRPRRVGPEGQAKLQEKKVAKGGFEATARLKRSKLLPGGPAIRLYVSFRIPRGRYVPAAKLELELGGSTSGLIINEPSYPPIRRRSREAPAYRGEIQIPVLIHAASSAIPGTRRLQVKLSFESGGEGVPDDTVKGKLELGVYVTVVGRAPVEASPAGNSGSDGGDQDLSVTEGSPLWPLGLGVFGVLGALGLAYLVYRSKIAPRLR